MLSIGFICGTAVVVVSFSISNKLALLRLRESREGNELGVCRRGGFVEGIDQVAQPGVMRPPVPRS